MKKIFPFLIALLLITSCSDDDSDRDLTEDIVGAYAIDANPNNGLINVSKTGNNTVSITFTKGRQYQFSDVILNSETSFTINEYKDERFWGECNWYDIYSGGGSLESNSITINLIRTRELREPTNLCSESDLTDQYSENFFNQVEISYLGVRQ